MTDATLIDRHIEWYEAYTRKQLDLFYGSMDTLLDKQNSFQSQLSEAAGKVIEKQLDNTLLTIQNISKQVDQVTQQATDWFKPAQ